MRFKFHSVSAVVLFSLMAMGGPVARASNLLLDPSFETPDIGATPGYLSVPVGGSIGAWTVVGNSVFIVNTTYTDTGLLFNAADGQQHLDLTGTLNEGPGVGVQQTVPTTVGLQYLLTFDVGHMGTTQQGYVGLSGVQLNINGVSQGIFTNDISTVPNQVNWESFSVPFTATSTTTTVAFLNQTPGTSTFGGLDFTALQPAGAPEPGTFVLFGLGLLAFGIGAYRSRRTA